jgi:hypothetical protein
MEGATEEVISEISNLPIGAYIISGVSVPITLKVAVEEFK